MPGQMAGNANVDGSPSTALIGAYNSRAEALIADANTVHVVWSKKHGVWWATSSASTWSRYAVLRSRRD